MKKMTSMQKKLMGGSLVVLVSISFLSISNSVKHEEERSARRESITKVNDESRKDQEDQDSIDKEYAPKVTAKDIKKAQSSEGRGIKYANAMYDVDSEILSTGVSEAMDDIITGVTSENDTLKNQGYDKLQSEITKNNDLAKLSISDATVSNDKNVNNLINKIDVNTGLYLQRIDELAKKIMNQTEITDEDNEQAQKLQNDMIDIVNNLVDLKGYLNQPELFNK